MLLLTMNLKKLLPRAAKDITFMLIVSKEKSTVLLQELVNIAGTQIEEAWKFHIR